MYAIPAVSGSLISPTMITSRSCLRMPLRVDVRVHLNLVYAVELIFHRASVVMIFI